LQQDDRIQGRILLERGIFIKEEILERVKVVDREIKRDRR